MVKGSLVVLVCFFVLFCFCLNARRLKISSNPLGSLRGARTCLAEAIRYARQRNTFGKRLIDHQVFLSPLFVMFFFFFDPLTKFVS